MTQEQSDKYYIKVAQLCADNSYAINLKVGAIIVKDGQIMSDGFNGTPCGFENKCEVKGIDYKDASDVTTRNVFLLFDKQLKL